MTNRALVLAALADGPSTLTGVLRSRDTDLMIAALRALGTTIEPAGDGPASLDDPDATTLSITPGELTGARIDCGLAGTVMRFLPPVAGLARGTSEFVGDEAARARPQATLLRVLRNLGVAVEGDAIPFTVTGSAPVEGGTVAFDASESSQFISGLMLTAPLFTSGASLSHAGSRPVPSRPHIDMTTAMLTDAGVTVEEPNDRTWRVHPGPIRPVDRVIEPDLSNATPFLAAAAATGGTVRIPHWPRHTTQAGDAIRDFLARMGCTVGEDPSDTEDVPGAEGSPTGAAYTLTVTGPDTLRAIDADLSAVGELTPTVAALCALADGTSRLDGIGHLRGHETDRLTALATELRKVGCTVEELDEGLVITPGRPPSTTVEWGAYADHRMATAGAIVGLVVEGVHVDDIGSTAKTLPGFADMWDRAVRPPVEADW